MHYHYFSRLLNILDGPNAIYILYREFGQPDYFTMDDVDGIVAAYKEGLDNQPLEYFRNMEINVKEVFIQMESLLVSRLLKPFATIKEPGSLTGPQTVEVHKSIQDAVGIAESLMEEYEWRLQWNYDTKYPMTVRNILAHIRNLIYRLGHDSSLHGIVFQGSLLDKGLRKWLRRLEHKYSTKALAIQLELIKQGPHPLHKQALDKVGFRDLFFDNKVYATIMQYWKTEGMLDRQGRWVYEGGKDKTLLPSLIKYLRDKAKCLRKDINLTDKIIHTAIVNSLDSSAKYRTVASAQPIPLHKNFLPQSENLLCNSINKPQLQ